MGKKYSKMFEKGLELMKKGDHFNAILVFNDCVPEGVKDADLWLNIAKAYRELKRASYAEPCLDYSLKIKSKNPEAEKLREKMGSEAFMQGGFMGVMDNPIKDIKVEGSSKVERCKRALNFFQPYLLLNSSSIEVIPQGTYRVQGTSEEKERNTIRVSIKGELGSVLVPMTQIEPDVQGILYQVEPSMHVVFVKMMNIFKLLVPYICTRIMY